MRTTIVVFPRERFSAVTGPLRSLFRTTDETVPVIVVEGASSPSLRQELAALKKQRDFEHISLPYLVTPNEARNIGGRRAETEFIVFSDNDIEYSPGWLEALEGNAGRNGAVAVAPLTFIGPTASKKIHHAGGILRFNTTRAGKTVLSEAHRLMNKPYDAVADKLDELAPVENDVCEFDCMVMRRAFFERMGGLDERLITREHTDFALRAKVAGEKVTFEKDSHIMYRAFGPFHFEDLKYHLFRWSDERTIQSIEAFRKPGGYTSTPSISGSTGSSVTAAEPPTSPPQDSGSPVRWTCWQPAAPSTR